MKPLIEKIGKAMVIRRECASCSERTSLYGHFREAGYVPICSDKCAAAFYESTEESKARASRAETWIERQASATSVAPLVAPAVPVEDEGAWVK